MLTVLAPAKINLTLEVLGKREDGYHEIRSIIQAISLYDRLEFNESDTIEIKADLPGWQPDKSLVSRTVELVRQAAAVKRGVSIAVSKRIPLLSGLGGDSSDAAATLRGLNQFWDLRLPVEELLKLARQLGSDVSFFLYDRAALVRGRGELVTPLEFSPHSWLVLVVPTVLSAQPGKTKRLYESLKPEYFTDGQITERLLRALRSGQPLVSLELFNVFEKVALSQFPALGTTWQQMLDAGAEKVHLAGSGPSLFVLAKDRSGAEELFFRLKQTGLDVHLAETVVVGQFTN